MEVRVNPTRCIGCGMCAAAVPEVFKVVSGKSTVLLPQPEGRGLLRAKDAANGCPVNAISLR